MEIKEVDEAIHAGLRTVNLLESAESCMDSGRKWGLWDIFGGGLISSWAKHSNINEAQKYLNMARSQLESFKKELHDVSININYGVGFDDFTQIADFVFDGLIVDLSVQSQIKESLEKIRDTIRQVNATLDRLYALKRELEK